jgi:hypothetical protein
MAVSAHPVVFSHLLPSHTWQVTCPNCGEKCESDSQVPLCFNTTEQRRKIIYNMLLKHSGNYMYQLFQAFLHLAPTSKKKQIILRETVTEHACFMAYTSHF